MLITDLRLGQSFKVGETSIKMIETKHNKVRLGIIPDPAVKITFEKKDSAHKTKQEV